MSTRTINISLSEQTPQIRTLRFIPRLASVDGDVLLRRPFVVETDEDGDAAVDLPVKASGSLRYDYEIDGLRIMWRNNGTGNYHINDFGDYDKNLSYYYDKSGAANPWEGTTWQHDVSGALPVPYVSLTPEPIPTAMRFDGAGSDPGQPLNVPVLGSYNGKPEYFLGASGSNDQIRARWTDECGDTAGFAWVWSIRHMNRYHYWSNENVEYPHYVTAWTVTGDAAPPTPTITAVY